MNAYLSLQTGNSQPIVEARNESYHVKKPNPPNFSFQR